MTWDWIALGAKDILGLVLAARLLVMRLPGVYRTLSLVVLYESLGSSVLFLMQLGYGRFLDYRLVWAGLSALGWVMTLWIVYALLEAVLEHLPGILHFSRRLLNFTFLAAVILALLTAKPEFSVNAGSAGGEAIGYLVVITVVMERVISTVALLVLLAILAFVVWFPVQMPKNLVVLSLGLVVYFLSRTGLLLARSFFSRGTSQIFSTVSMFVLSACFSYWAIGITREGESGSLRIGHGWRRSEQQRLILQLENMNAALLRGARR